MVDPTDYALKRSEDGNFQYLISLSMKGPAGSRYLLSFSRQRDGSTAIHLPCPCFVLVLFSLSEGRAILDVIRRSSQGVSMASCFLSLEYLQCIVAQVAFDCRILNQDYVGLGILVLARPTFPGEYTGLLTKLLMQ